MHTSRAHTAPKLEAYLSLTRRLQGARASADAYRSGRHGALVASIQADAEPAHPRDPHVVLPFRPR